MDAQIKEDIFRALEKHINQMADVQKLSLEFLIDGPPVYKVMTGVRAKIILNGEVVAFADSVTITIPTT